MVVLILFTCYTVFLILTLLVVFRKNLRTLHITYQEAIIMILLKIASMTTKNGRMEFLNNYTIITNIYKISSILLHYNCYLFS